MLGGVLDTSGRAADIVEKGRGWDTIGRGWDVGAGVGAEDCEDVQANPKSRGGVHNAPSHPNRRKECLALWDTGVGVSLNPPMVFKSQKIGKLGESEWRGRDSNPRPGAYETPALTN